MRRSDMTRTLAAVVIAGTALITGCSEDAATSADSSDVGSSGEADAVDDGTSNVTTIDPGAPTTMPSPTSTVVFSTSRLDAELDAGEFATMLSNSHRAIVDPGSSSDIVAQNGRQMQLALRALADVPEFDEEVLAALDPAARPSIERIVRARQFLQARSAADTTPSEPPTELPAWTILEPEPVDILLAHYAEAEALTGIPWYWLAAIHLQETRMGRIQGVSSAGAVGPMQFLPTTWAQCCTGDPLASRDAIIGAATYLAQSGGPADMNAAVYQYNPNDGYVAVVTAYAETLRDEPALYRGLHAFQVFFGTSAGTVRLPIGYAQSAPVDAAAYLAENPADVA
jgi:membrane-bound lytic murein transglycosylase B